MKLSEVLAKYDKATEFYISEVRGKGASARTVENYEGRINNFRSFFIRLHEGDDEVKDPWYPDFQAWRDYLVEKEYTARSIERIMSDVRNFFGVCSDPELGDMAFYERNPFPSRLIPSASAQKDRARPYNELLSDADIVRLWDPVYKISKRTEKAWERNYAIVVLLLTTGIRNKELLDLTLADVDFEYNEIQVKKGKGNKYRCIEVPELAMAAIKRYLNGGGRPDWVPADSPLFGTQRAKEKGAPANDATLWNRGSKEWLSQVVRRHVKSVTGVDGIRTHDLRHVGARLDLNSGVSLWELQAKLGHASVGMTQHYAGKLQTRRRRESAKKVVAERDAAVNMIG